jgi:hypothetical protein
MCKSVKKKVKGKKKKVQKCTTQLTSSPRRFTAIAARASIARAGRIYATGSLRADQLTLHAVKALRAGRYTLTLTTGTGKRKLTTRARVTVGKTMTIGSLRAAVTR